MAVADGLAGVTQSVTGGVGVVQVSGSGNVINQSINISIRPVAAAALVGMQVSASARKPVTAAGQQVVRDALDKGFSLDEIKGLRLEVGLDYDDVPGSTTS